MIKNRAQSIFLHLVFLVCLSFPLQGEQFLRGYNNFVPPVDSSPYRFPTQRYLSLHSLTEVNAELEEQGIFLRQYPFYDKLKNQEEPGHIGYHAASHQFRVFQDIIRIVFEEVLGLEFKKDFYFFRIPGDPSLRDYSHAWLFLNDFTTVNDNLPEQRDQLISVNFTLFNNYNQKYECTPVFFELARSFKPPSFQEKIGLLFDLVGMPHDEIPTLFDIGTRIEHLDGGVMFQLFDVSYQIPGMGHWPYEILDIHAYPCIKKGVPTDPNIPLSYLYMQTDGSDFMPQYRLVVNNKSILNPYSTLTIRRYDLNDLEVVKDYERQLRRVIKSISYDPVQANIYKNQLLKYWNKT